MSTDFIKNRLKKTDGVIFDLDGTLWDSSAQIAQAWNELLKTRPHVIRDEITQEELYANMGLPMYEIAANLFPDLEPSSRNALMDEMGVFENEYLLRTGGNLFPAVKEVVNEVSSRYPVFVVSNCQSGYIEAFISAHGFDGIFKDHICWGDTGNCKGDNISLISERNGLKAPIYIGDTDSDSKACKKSGVPFVFAAYGFGNTREYDEKIDHPSDILSLLSL